MNQITPPIPNKTSPLTKNGKTTTNASDDNQALAAIFASLLTPTTQVVPDQKPRLSENITKESSDDLVQVIDQSKQTNASPNQGDESLSQPVIPRPQLVPSPTPPTPPTMVVTNSNPNLVSVNISTTSGSELSPTAEQSSQLTGLTKQSISVELSSVAPAVDTTLLSDNVNLNKDSKQISTINNFIDTKNVTNLNTDVINNFEDNSNKASGVEKSLQMLSKSSNELKPVTEAQEALDSTATQDKDASKVSANTTVQLPSQVTEVPSVSTENMAPNQGSTITNTPVITTVKIESQPLMPTNQINNMAQVITQQVKTMGSGDTKVVVFRLEPAGLGPINVNLKINQQQVSVEFKMEQSQTHQMLAAAMPKLQEILKATTDTPMQINNPAPTPVVTNVSAPTNHTLSDMNQQMMFNQQGQHGHGQPFAGDKRKAYQGPQEVVVEPVETQPEADATVSILV